MFKILKELLIYLRLQHVILKRLKLLTKFYKNHLNMVDLYAEYKNYPFTYAQGTEVINYIQELIFKKEGVENVGSGAEQ